MPAALTDIPWELIQAAICNLELTYEETAKRYGVKSATIRQRAKRYKWPVPNAVRERIKEIQIQRSQQKQIAMSRGVSQTEQKADIWLERQQETKQLGYEVGIQALKTLKKKPIPVTSWKDANYAHEMARKAVGLDKSDSENQGNPFGWLVVMHKGNANNRTESTADAIEINEQ